MPTLQTITDDLVIGAIRAAQKRVVLVAPAVWPGLAGAVSDAWARLGAEQVAVILDVDPEVLRFGYGSLEGLQILQRAAASQQQSIGQESGVRICVIIADDQTFLYSPTPRLLEATPGSCAEPATTTPKTNGLVLSQPPDTLQQDLGVGAERTEARTVGLEPVQANQIEAVAKELKANPPKSFDIARAVNVYNARIRFVELQVTGCKLSGQRASLPRDLVRIAKANPALERKIQNTIRVLDETDDLISKVVPTQGPSLDLFPDESAGFVGPPAPSEGQIFRLREEISKEFLAHVTGGTVIQRSRIVEFEERIQALRGLVELFSEVVSSKLVDRYVAIAKELAEELLPSVKSAMPGQWHRRLGRCPSDDQVRYCIQDALLRSFGNPDTKVKKMKVDLTYKEVTYEMLRDPGFIRQISQHYPDLQHLEEYTAARERDLSLQPSSAR